MSLPFDARPLTEPADRATVRSYVQQVRQSGRAPAAGGMKLVMGILVGVVFLLIFGSTFFSIVAGFLSMGAGGSHTMLSSHSMQIQRSPLVTCSTPENRR